MPGDSVDFNSKAFFEAIKKNENILPFLEQLNRLDKGKKALVLKETDDKGWNALIYAAEFAPKQLGILIQAINDLEYEDKAQIYKYAGGNGWSALLTAARYAPEQLGSVIDAINKLNDADKAQIYKQITKNGWNVLMMVARCAPEQLGRVIEAVNSLNDADKAQIYKQIIKEGWNVLLLAARYAPEQLVRVIEAVNSLNDADKAQIYKQITKEKEGWSVLMMVAGYAPGQLGGVFGAINSLSDEDRTAILMSATRGGWNAFSLLAYNFPESLLSALSNKIPESLQMPLFSQRIKETDDVKWQKVLKSDNILQGLLKSGLLEGVKAVLNAVSLWEIANQESFLTALNDNKENALRLAVSHPQMLSLVLDRIRNFSPDVMAQLFLQKDKQGIDVLTELLTHYPNQAQMVLAFIADLPPETQTVILRGHEKALVEIVTNQALNKYSVDSLSTTMGLVLKLSPEILTKLHNVKVFPELINVVKDAGLRRILVKTEIESVINILDKKITECYPQEGSTETPQVVSAYEGLKVCWQQYLSNTDRAQEPRLKKEVLSAIKKTQPLVSDLDYDAKNLLEAILEAIYSVIRWLSGTETKHQKIFRQLDNSMNQYSPPFFTSPGKIIEQEAGHNFIPSAPEKPASRNESDEDTEQQPGL